VQSRGPYFQNFVRIFARSPQDIPVFSNLANLFVDEFFSNFCKFFHD